jgi:hypothetical protein
MLHFIFLEKRVKNLKQTLICIKHIPNTYFYSTTYLFLALMGSWALVKAQHIKFNFCCYNVQISLIMSQPTQSDIFHNKIDAKCIVVSDFIVKCMLHVCNILEYCSQILEIHGQRALQLILFLFMTL